MLLPFLLFSKPGFGWSLAPVGELLPSGGAYGALGASFVFSPWVNRHVGDIEAELQFAPVSPYLEAVNLKLSSPLFWLIKNPFRFIFSNSVYWAPKLALGAQYRMPNDWAVYMSIAPLSFQDNEYVYEFLSPYVLYDFENNRWGWGAYIMKFAYFFGGTDD